MHAEIWNDESYTKTIQAQKNVKLLTSVDEIELDKTGLFLGALFWQQLKENLVTTNNREPRFKSCQWQSILIIYLVCVNCDGIE